jgi:signal transduction histidine kinase
LIAGVLLDLAELVCCGLPLFQWLRNLPTERMWLEVAFPLTLAVWAAAALRMAYLLRPLLDVAAAIRQGGKIQPPKAEEIHQALSRAPREIAVVHLVGWAVVAVVLCVHAARAGERDAFSAAALVQMVLLASAGLAATRMLAIEIILAPARPFLLPGLQGIRVFADRYRGALLAVGLALLGVWQLLLALFASTLVPVPGGVLTSGSFVLWPILVLGAFLWWRLLVARLLPVEAYFNLAVRTKGGKGPSRDDPKAVAAFVAAQRAPYALAKLQMAVLLLAGAGATFYLVAAAGLALRLAGRLGLVLALVSLVATHYQTILVQQFLRPLIQHLGSRHALPLEEVRAPHGLGVKLGVSVVAVLVISCAFVWLAACGRADPFLGFAPMVVAAAMMLGIVALVVRNVVAPLRALEERSGEMARGQLARPVPPWGEADEIGRLAVIFEEMRRSLRDRLRSTESINVDLEREVRRRTEALEQRNAELFEAMEKLRRAQDNLVRSEKLASMGRLVAGIAHEINNPVNAVINSLGPLDEIVKKIASGDAGQTAALGKEAEEILAVVQRGATRTKAIVQALHGYARGDDSVQREVSLARSVDDSLGLLQHRLRHVKVNKDVDAKARIMGFPGQIDQVLMNLLTNAAQAIGEGGGTITVGAHCQDDRVLLRVADDGPGMSAEVLARIFDPFFTTKDVGEGSGLGLSIVHGIVERHGGNIDVDSHPGQGTKFSISFPLPPAANWPKT